MAPCPRLDQRRRGPLRALLLLLGLAIVPPPTSATAAGPGPRRPNIVFLLADDLGSGDLSITGQQRFATPNIDRIAREGMHLRVHYAGSAVCAPSRCVLMTGKHPGHAFIRENRQHTPRGEGQWPVPEGTLKLPLTLQSLGYITAGFGKWGLGAPGTTGVPNRQGFDRFFGFNCQAVAHNSYPTALWDNDTPVPLANPPFPAHARLAADVDPADPASYAGFVGHEYAPDRISAEARRFIQEHRDRPFFLYYPTTVPHLALQVPDDALAEFAGRFPETPYTGNRGYLPHRTPRAAYAAMVTRLDREVGRLLDLLDLLDLTRDTIVVFSSDNGPLYDGLGGTDTDFFRSAGDFKGRKGSLDEGGVRVPTFIRWPGHIAAGSTSERVTGFEDWLPTLLDLIGASDRAPADLDGLSFAPTLLGRDQPERPFLYRETPGYGGQQSIRVGPWKAIRRRLNSPAKQPLDPGPIELYDLATDPTESHDLAAKHPDRVAALQALLKTQHQPSALFPIRALDPAPDAAPAP